MLLSARKASRSLAALTDSEINSILLEVADALTDNADVVIGANALDLQKMPVDDPRYDRLMLTRERIEAIAADTRNVASLDSPRIALETRTLANGLQLTKQAVPFGVIGVIYEARPNVSVDVFSLCFKSANVCVLKGGRDAEQSNKALVNIIHGVLAENGIDTGVLTMLPSSREATEQLLLARGKVDMIIPRGSARLIDEVRSKATVPVIETGAGVCHCYVDASADIAMAANIVYNAKTRRVSVCNALDCLIINAASLEKLPVICAPLADKKVKIHADNRAMNVLKGCYPTELLSLAEESDYGTEFLAYEMAVKTVDSYKEAIAHIDVHGSGHSEAAVTNDFEIEARFFSDVDAACVYVNAPTSFTDGAQFGLGAEIGISTQKLHARGPMALRELMTYKWLIKGAGQVRP